MTRTYCVSVNEVTIARCVVVIFFVWACGAFVSFVCILIPFQVTETDQYQTRIHCRCRRSAASILIWIFTHLLETPITNHTRTTKLCIKKWLCSIRCFSLLLLFSVDLFIFLHFFYFVASFFQSNQRRSADRTNQSIGGKVLKMLNKVKLIKSLENNKKRWWWWWFQDKIIPNFKKF